MSKIKKKSIGFGVPSIIGIAVALVKDRRSGTNYLSIQDICDSKYKISKSVSKRLGIDFHVDIDSDEVVDYIEIYGHDMGIYTDGLHIIVDSESGYFTTGDELITDVLPDKILRKPMLVSTIIESMDRYKN